MNSYEEKRQSRIERYKDRAAYDMTDAEDSVWKQLRAAIASAKETEEKS